MNNGLFSSIFTADPVLEFCDLFNGISPLWDYSLHRHSYIELVYRKTGHGQTDLLEGKQNFTFFDTMVYPVNCWHQDKFKASEENVAYCLWISMPEITLDKPLQVQDRSGKLGHLFHSIYEECQKPNASRELLSLMIRTLLIQILMFSQEREPTNIDRVIQYLSAHAAEKITLDELANLCFISKSYLAKQFKQKTGQTIIGYLNSIRIDAAKMMLITTSKTVEEIAYSLGFNSPKYFFRIFKSITGITPASFCKRRKLSTSGNDHN